MDRNWTNSHSYFNWNRSWNWKK